MNRVSTDGAWMIRDGLNEPSWIIQGRLRAEYLIVSKYMKEAALKITEIFFSLQGETTRVGLPTIFIRLTGCPLRCRYCDTAYAFYNGEWFTLSEILTTVANYQPRYVTVTGGEPLAQKQCFPLLTSLCDAGYHVSLETGGSIDIAAVDKRVIKILDIKTPGSGESHQTRYENIDFLLPQDQIKLVICDQQDYEWSKQILSQYNSILPYTKVNH